MAGVDSTLIDRPWGMIRPFLGPVSCCGLHRARGARTGLDPVAPCGRCGL